MISKSSTPNTTMQAWTKSGSGSASTKALVRSTGAVSQISIAIGGIPHIRIAPVLGRVARILTRSILAKHYGPIGLLIMLLPEVLEPCLVKLAPDQGVLRVLHHREDEARGVVGQKHVPIGVEKVRGIGIVDKRIGLEETDYPERVACSSRAVEPDLAIRPGIAVRVVRGLERRIRPECEEVRWELVIERASRAPCPGHEDREANVFDLGWHLDLERACAQWGCLDMLLPCPVMGSD